MEKMLLRVLEREKERNFGQRIGDERAVRSNGLEMEKMKRGEFGGRKAVVSTVPKIVMRPVMRRISLPLH